MKQSFITAINCIDGRVQEPLISFIKKEFSAEYIDLVTEPGPDKILSEITKEVEYFNKMKKEDFKSERKKFRNLYSKIKFYFSN